jgi:hypothetical protein
MSVAPRYLLRVFCFALAMPMAPALAQTEATPRPPMTASAVEDFLTDAGLQACEISEIDTSGPELAGAIKSFSIGVAEDCATYDPQNPTVVNVHQFADQESRDAMVARLQNLRFRALRAYGDVWVVDDFVVVLLGPQREEVGALLKKEYRRRHPEED